MDFAGALVAHWGMRVTPMPRRGAVLAGRDHGDRMLRVSYHPDVERVVVSIWEHDICLATLRLAPQDVPDLVRGLTAALLPTPVPAPAPTPTQSPTSTRTPAQLLRAAPTQPSATVAAESPWQRPGPPLPPVPLSPRTGRASA